MLLSFKSKLSKLSHKLNSCWPMLCCCRIVFALVLYDMNPLIKHFRELAPALLNHILQLSDWHKNSVLSLLSSDCIQFLQFKEALKDWFVLNVSYKSAILAYTHIYTLFKFEWIKFRYSYFFSCWWLVFVDDVWIGMTFCSHKPHADHGLGPAPCMSTVACK